LVCGIVSIFLFALILSPLAIIFGILGLKKENARGMAIAGLITGGIGFIGWIITIFVLGAFLANLGF
jgi:hypothetical protein